MYTIDANTLTPADLPRLNRLTADLGRGQPREHPWSLFEKINANATVYVARNEAIDDHYKYTSRI